MMVLTPLGPMAGLFASDAEAAVGTRHVYEFSDGSVEHIALYQGANPDMGASVSLPKGAMVTDVSLTLSGASATGWSQVVADDRVHWNRGASSNTDSRSGELTLAMDNVSHHFLPPATTPTSMKTPMRGSTTGPSHCVNLTPATQRKRCFLSS